MYSSMFTTLFLVRSISGFTFPLKLQFITIFTQHSPLMHKMLRIDFKVRKRCTLKMQRKHETGTIKFYHHSIVPHILVGAKMLYRMCKLEYKWRHEVFWNYFSFLSPSNYIQDFVWWTKRIIECWKLECKWRHEVFWNYSSFITIQVHPKHCLVDKVS